MIGFGFFPLWVIGKEPLLVSLFLDFTCGQQRKVYASWTRSQNLWLSVQGGAGGRKQATHYPSLKGTQHQWAHSNKLVQTCNFWWVVIRVQEWPESKSNFNLPTVRADSVDVWNGRRQMSQSNSDIRLNHGGQRTVHGAGRALWSPGGSHLSHRILDTSAQRQSFPYPLDALHWTWCGADCPQSTLETSVKTPGPLLKELDQWEQEACIVA